MSAPAVGLVEPLLALAREAGAAIMRVYAQDFAVQQKDDRSPLTEADMASHHLILAGRWRMTQGDHEYELGPGDYIAWDPAVPHDVENVGDVEGRLLVIYPRHARRTADGTERSRP